MTAAQHWERALAGWGLPDDLVAAAAVDPWALAPEDLPAGRGTDDGHDRTLADDVAADALPRGGSVLDVGCGPGGSSLALRGRAGRFTGVDGSQAMLVAYAAALQERPSGARGLLSRAPTVVTVEGTWPAVADEVAPHDVVVCRNVLYNVNDGVTAFVAALDAHARGAVVLTVTDEHPRAWLRPYLEQLHGITWPREPTSATAIDLVREVTGRAADVHRWTSTNAKPVGDEAVRLVARGCAVGADRIDDVRTALRRVPPSTRRGYTTIVWSGAG